MSEGYYYGQGDTRPVTWTAGTRALIERLVAELPGDVRADLDLRRPAIARGKHFIAMGFEDGLAFRLVPPPPGRQQIRRGAAKGMTPSPAAARDEWPSLLAAAYTAAG